MPPSIRRSERKRSATTRAEALDSSPSRPTAKRRKPAPTTERPCREEKTPSSEVPEDSAEETSSEAEIQTVADSVIPYLHVAKYQVVVATQHSNPRVAERVSAFAKVCGRDWTYYVQGDPVAVIGRPPDPVSRPDSNFDTESSPVPRDDSPKVHIDLGPSKLVSRFHARIFYASEDQKWHIEVKGRNGAQLNTQRLSRNQDVVVSSGDVVDIGGTQMMFVTAEGQAVVHPVITQQIGATLNDDDSGRIGVVPHAHPEPSFVTAPSSSYQRDTTATTAFSQSNGKTVIAPAPPDFVRPVTPQRSPKKSQRSSSAVKQSPAYGQSFMIESTEQIDYSGDATKNLKPSIPYAVMITQAILSSPDETRTLDGIYKWIMQNFAYYRHLKTNWQNSIRHVLSLNRCFEKVPRGKNEPGKGMKWRVTDEKRGDMVMQLAKHMKRSTARPMSLPNSPSTLREETTQPYAPSGPAPPQQSSESNGILKTSPPEPSPPLAAYPRAQESYTPSRGSRQSTGLGIHDHAPQLPTFSDAASPIPYRRNNIKAGITDSSPVLNSGVFDGPMMTPAPRPHNLNALLPGTVRLPTSHMPDSSPAPFWKYGGDSMMGSTPARPTEVSPLKGMMNLQSSSPPPPMGTIANGDGSPTRGRGGRTAGAMEDFDNDDDDEDGGIDITGGFLPISKYHHDRGAAAAAAAGNNAVRTT